MARKGKMICVKFAHNERYVFRKNHVFSIRYLDCETYNRVMKSRYFLYRLPENEKDLKRAKLMTKLQAKKLLEKFTVKSKWKIHKLNMKEFYHD